MVGGIVHLTVQATDTNIVADLVICPAFGAGKLEQRAVGLGQRNCRDGHGAVGELTHSDITLDLGTAGPIGEHIDHHIGAGRGGQPQLIAVVNSGDAVTGGNNSGSAVALNHHHVAGVVVVNIDAQLLVGAGKTACAGRRG